MTKDLIELESRLGFSFKDKSLLTLALTHSSFFYENPGSKGHNERLEFIGDSALSLIISLILIKLFPDYEEGELTKIRAMLVNKKTLAELSRRFGIGDFLLLGRGEEISYGRDKDRILADTLEAIIGSILLDSGFEDTNMVVKRLFKELIDQVKDGSIIMDYKSMLQELCHSKFKVSPTYILISETGPDHNRNYEVHVEVNGKPYGRGSGRSKKEAEEGAAMEAYQALKGD